MKFHYPHPQSYSDSTLKPNDIAQCWWLSHIKPVWNKANNPKTMLKSCTSGKYAGDTIEVPSWFHTSRHPLFWVLYTLYIYMYDCVCIDGMWYTESLYVWYIYICIIYIIHNIGLVAHPTEQVAYNPSSKSANHEVWPISPRLRAAEHGGRVVPTWRFRQGWCWRNHVKAKGKPWDFRGDLGKWQFTGISCEIHRRMGKTLKNCAKLPCFSNITENHL